MFSDLSEETEERAYRRGAHEAFAMAAERVRTMQSLEEVKEYMNKMTMVLREMRSDMKTGYGVLIHQAEAEAGY